MSEAAVGLKDKLAGWWQAAVTFLSEVWQEVNPKTGKVTWPNRDQVVSSTVVVVVVVVVLSGYLGLLDLVFTKLRELLLGIGR